MTKKVVNVEEGTVTFQFDDGAEQVFRLSDCSPDIASRLALHGASQKIGDSYAGAGEADDPLGYAKASVEQVIAQLVAGDWRVAAVGGPRVTDLATALSRATGQSIEAATETVNEMDNGQKKALRKHPKIALELATITAERAKARAESLAEAASAAAPLPGMAA